MLRADGIGRRLEDCRGRWVWRNLHLELAAGESVAVTGPSGTGKSLLLRALAGLDPLQEGEVYLAGRPQGAGPMPAYRARVVYVAQRPWLGDGTVEDNLRRPLTLEAHRRRPYPRTRVLAWLEALGRQADFLEKPAAGLSGGEAQLVALLRALLVDPGCSCWTNLRPPWIPRRRGRWKGWRRPG